MNLKSNQPQPPAINRKPSAIALRALKIAREEIGVMESPEGSNDGPRVREYLKRVKLGPGYAWCMAFMYWCFDEAAAQLGQKNPLLCTGGVLAGYRGAKGKNIQLLQAPIHPDAIRPGDIMIMRFDGGHGHTGIIDRVSGNTVITIEGNTNKAGSREGIGVFEKRRNANVIYGIIRVTE